MIDLKDFRENPDKYRHAAEVKRVNVDVDHVLQLDGERLRSQQAFERLRAEQNEASTQIAALKDVTAYYAGIDASTERQARALEAGVPTARVVRLRSAHYIFLFNELDTLREMRAFLVGLK